MRAALALAICCISAAAHAQQTGDGAFNISPAPCDAKALASGSWCMDAMSTMPPTGPTIPPPPTITGPFATLIVKTVQLTGTGIAGDTVAIAIDGNKDPGLVTVQASGFWVFNASATLTNGTHIATAIQTNTIGPSAASAPFTFAVAAP